MCLWQFHLQACRKLALLITRIASFSFFHPSTEISSGPWAHSSAVASNAHSTIAMSSDIPKVRILPKLNRTPTRRGVNLKVAWFIFTLINVFMALWARKAPLAALLALWSILWVPPLHPDQATARPAACVGVGRIFIACTIGLQF